MDRTTLEFLQNLVISIHANIRELRERKTFADPEEQSYIDGKLQAYNEMLSMIRSEAKDAGISSSEFGL